jgi:hypothetical protein
VPPALKGTTTMEMINRLTEDALDSQKFVDRIKAAESELQTELSRQLHGHTYAGENRAQRRARERAERKAEMRAAKARP